MDAEDEIVNDAEENLVKGFSSCNSIPFRSIPLAGPSVLVTRTPITKSSQPETQPFWIPSFEVCLFEWMWHLEQTWPMCPVLSHSDTFDRFLQYLHFQRKGFSWFIPKISQWRRLRIVLLLPFIVFSGNPNSTWAIYWAWKEIGKSDISTIVTF